MKTIEHIQIPPVNRARNHYLAGQNARLAAELRAMAERIKRATPALQAGAIRKEAA